MKAIVIGMCGTCPDIVRSHRQMILTAIDPGCTEYREW